MNTQTIFFRQFIDDFFHMGAILPSSRYLGRAAAAYLALKQGPVTVLEAGAGTGAFTREITPLLEPGDTLDLVEINTRLMAHLRQQFGQNPALALPQEVTINFINGDLRLLRPQPRYDYIIFSLPLTNFPPAMVREILTLMMACLKSGGVFSYVKYIFLGQLKYAFGSAATRETVAANHAIIAEFARRYQIERRVVVANVPPTWVHYWRK